MWRIAPTVIVLLLCVAIPGLVSSPTGPSLCTEYQILCNCSIVCDHGHKWGEEACAGEAEWEKTEACYPGSVVVEPWLQHGIHTQRNLSLDIPLNLANLPGTHNSGISVSEGQGLGELVWTKWLQKIDPNYFVRIANQQLSWMDQLRIGIRMLEVDTHYFGGALRIGHCGGVHLKAMNEIIELLNKLFGLHIDYDSETLGCFSDRSQTLAHAFDEISTYLKMEGNEMDVLVLMFDDEEDLQQWGLVPELLATIRTYFTDIGIFTPNDKLTKYPDRWPTFRELLRDGTRVIFASGADYGEQMEPLVFYKYGPLFSNWTEFDPVDLLPYPACALQEGSEKYFTDTGRILRVVADTLEYGPFWNGTEGGNITPTNQSLFTECNVNWPCMDQARPDTLKQAIWSWEYQYPEAGGCTIMTVNSSRWQTSNCQESHYFACVDRTDATKWQFSTTSGPFPSDSTVADPCPSGYTFAVPHQGLHNQLLYEVVKRHSQPVWLNWIVEQE